MFSTVITAVLYIDRVDLLVILLIFLLEQILEKNIEIFISDNI